MGYSTTATGEITFTPPISHVQLRESAPMLEVLNLPITDEEREVDTDTFSGTLRVRSCGVITLRLESGRSLQEWIAKDLELILKTYTLHGRDFAGFFEVLGEDGARFRIWLQNDNGRTVVRDAQPKLVWPEGTPGDAA